MRVADLGISLPNAGALLLVAVGAAIAWGQIDTRVDHLEQDQEEHEERTQDVIKDLQDNHNKTHTQQVTIQTNQSHILQTLDKILEKVEELEDE